MATIKANYNSSGEVISYRLRCCVGRDENTYKQVFRTKTINRPDGLTPAKERKEVERLADEWERAQKADYGRSKSKEDRQKITLANFIENHWWPDHVLDGEHKPTSVQFFRYMSDDIIGYFGKKKQLAKIDGEAVKRYVKYLRTEATTKTGKPYSAATVQHHFGTLRNIMEYARRFHYIQTDPCQDLSAKEKPHRDKKRVDFLSPADAQRFMQCLSNEPLYWQCLMNVLITTGLRRGEAVGLQWGDIDGENLSLSVVRNVTMDREAESKLHIGTTKTGEERTVPISQRLHAMLMALKHQHDGAYGVLLPSAFVFCAPADPYRPLYPTEPTRWQRKFVKRNSLPNVSPHDLRHTAATLALEAGANLKEVQELLGHADPSTTMAFYAGVTEEAKRRTVDGIESLIV
ncbi:MAG: site-specific integrase [Clostridiales bacterium]|nr:site-specific integrase [Candidatus Cacconaster stercorequi]